jgi:hypothetical protein
MIKALKIGYAKTCAYSKIMIVISILAISLLSSLPSFAQVYNGPDSLQLLSIVWKANGEVLKTLHDESTQLDAYLSSPGLQEVDHAVFLSEKYMVTYLQEDVQSGKLLNEAIMKSYKKVLTDAKNDPSMALLPDGMLGTYIPRLIESLTAVPKPNAQ